MKAGGRTGLRVGQRAIGDRQPEHEYDVAVSGAATHERDAATVTVLLTDIEAGTRLWEERRGCALGVRLEQHDAVLHSAIANQQRHGVEGRG